MNRVVTMAAIRPRPDVLQLDALCQWIDAHLDENIGWPQLIEVSGLSARDIQELFYKYRQTTPMTHIRLMRERAQSAGAGARATSHRSTLHPDAQLFDPQRTG